MHEPVWVDENGDHFIQATADDVTDLVVHTRAFVKKYTARVPSKAAIIYAWNENSETSGVLIPTLGNGTALLDGFAKGLNS